MKLSDSLPLIRTGDVFLFRGRSLFAYLIKLRTRSVYSHAGVAIRVKANGLERVCVLEALEPFGVRLFPIELYVDRGEEIDWFQVIDTTINREAVAAYALGQWGKRYAIRQLWWSFSRVARLVKKLWSPHPDPDHFFCSQLVAEALRHAGFQADENLVPIETDPGAVARFTCLQRRGTFTP
jgi:Permuted papain-like amidase enzyme, YaeF/YiiX, C92 family